MEIPQADIPEKNEKVTVQQIVDGVVTMIHQGVFCPGKPIREIELCNRFHVSRTPVREALRTLQSSGIVEYIPRCGVQVVELSEQDLLYMAETRTALEIVSAREAAAKITMEQVRELRQINQNFLKHKETDTASELDVRFHMLIAQISGNSALASYLENLIMRQAVLVPLIPIQPQRIDFSYEEHEAIVRGLELRDPELAAKYAEIHFHMSQKSLQNKFQKYLQNK